MPDLNRIFAKYSQEMETIVKPQMGKDLSRDFARSAKRRKIVISAVIAAIVALLGVGSVATASVISRTIAGESKEKKTSEITPTETVTPTETPEPQSPQVPQDIPEGFLVNESSPYVVNVNNDTARTWWPSPCKWEGTDSLPALTDPTPPVARRHLALQESVHYRTETLAVYENAGVSQSAFDNIQAEFVKCQDFTPGPGYPTIHWERAEVNLGDAAVAYLSYVDGEPGVAVIFVREGSAIASYYELRPPEGWALINSKSMHDATIMTEKLCRYDTHCSSS